MAVMAVMRELQIYSLASLPRPIAARVRVQQLNSAAICMLIMSFTGQGTVLLTVWEYWDLDLHTALLSATGLISLSYAAFVINAMRWLRTSPAACGGTDKMLKRFVVAGLALGTAWAILEIVLMSHSGPGQRALLYGIIIGMMSAPAMVTPCSAAFAFWAPVTVGGLVSIGLVSSIRDPGGTFLLTGYTFMSLFCLLYINRSFIKRVVADIQQSDARATIDLLLREFEDSAADWLWETDSQNRLTHVSARFAEVAGVPVSGLLGQGLLTLLRSGEPSNGALVAAGFGRNTDIETLMDRRLSFREVEVAVRLGGRSMCWALTGKPKLEASGRFEGFRGVGSDITEKNAAKDRADFLARFDELTGLANRRCFREKLDAGLSLTVDPPLAVLCLDLDGFKAVNDRYGHAIGDALLRMFADRLGSLLRDSDVCARLGGDEFAVTVFGLNEQAVLGIASRMISELSRSYSADSLVLTVGVSVGIAIAGTIGQSADDLLKNADTALYQAKAEGRGTWRLFDKKLQHAAERRLELQEGLAKAIAADGLSLMFQPIAELSSRRTIAVEALVRWRHDGQFVPSSEFVPLAEDCGLIFELGRWVLRQACMQAALLAPDIRMAINVSPLQLRDRGFLLDLRSVLAETGISAARLDIELTETAFLDIDQTTLDLLDEIHALGIGIILDDFGVGQTSLDHLRKYPFSVIKIDQSFIREMPTSRASRAIVRGVVGMARELGIATTAEGIETAEHLNIVRELGCDYWQGYLLGRPEELVHVMGQTRPEMETVDP